MPTTQEPVGAICIPCLKNKLKQAPSIIQDNVAQDLIQELSDTELAQIPAHLKQDLHEALSAGWVSSRDQAALDRLAQASKAAAINILKDSKKLSQATKNVLDPRLIEGIYQAEAKRLNVLEHVGIDGETIGRGQIGQEVYQDVMRMFKDEMINKGGYREITEDYQQDLKKPILEDFATAASLALKVEESQRAGRNAEDALKFGLGLYRGARSTLYDVQKQAKEFIHYPPVERLLKAGTEKQQDIANYIEEVTSFIR